VADPRVYGYFWSTNNLRRASEPDSKLDWEAGCKTATSWLLSYRLWHGVHVPCVSLGGQTDRALVLRSQYKLENTRRLHSWHESLGPYLRYLLGFQ
jgi:hypothetical protein